MLLPFISSLKLLLDFEAISSASLSGYFGKSKFYFFSSDKREKLKF